MQACPGGDHMRIISACLLLLGCAVPQQALDRDGDGVPEGEDCDDAHASVFPGASEVCDGLDNDCDGQVDNDPEDGLQAWLDEDDDGWGGQETVTCRMGAGIADRGGDCDDGDDQTWPGATELCDAADRDCDGDPTLGAVDQVPGWADSDGDGSAGTRVPPACEHPEHISLTLQDCDDTDPSIHPGAYEACDRVDQDCDGDLGFDATVGVDAESIPAALDATRRTSDPVEICITTGTWDLESRTLVDRDVTLVGQDRDRTVLRGAGNWFDVVDGRLRLQGVSLFNLRDAPAIHSDGATIEVEDVHVDGVIGTDVVSGALVKASGGQVHLREVAINSVDLEAEPGNRGVLVALDDGTASLRQVSVQDITWPLHRTGTRSPNSLFYFDHATADISDLSIRGGSIREDPYTGASPFSLLVARHSTLDVERLDVDEVDMSLGQGAVLRGMGSSVTLTDIDISDLDLGRTDGLFYLEEATLTLRGARISRVESHTLLVSGWYSSDIEMHHLELADCYATHHTFKLLYPSGTVLLRNVISAGNVMDPPPRTGSTPDVWLMVWPGLRTGDGGTGLDLRIENATFAGDVTNTWDRALFFEAFGANATLRNVHFGAGWAAEPERALFWGGDGSLTLDHVSFEGPDERLVHWEGTGTVSRSGLQFEVEPLFVDVSDPDPTVWDVHLQPGSPLIDAGTPTLKDGDGSRSDIGAYGGPGGGRW